MLPELQQYIDQEQLFSPADRLILAVSGGVDSMVMLNLFQQLTDNFIVAHCNFKLRDIESDTDEIFLRDFCAENGIELYVKTFETRDYAKMEGISIEMAARDLRYNWFNELLKKLHFNYLATAHHQDDLVETMLINLSRGTGVRGLSGIQPKAGQIIRPLLFADRLQILNYAAAQKISFREDSSNEELVYQRNIIRHKIIPQFEEINPAFRKNMSKTASILRDTESIYRQKIEEEQNQLLDHKDKITRISIEKLLAVKQKSAILYEMLNPLGFNSDQIKEIIHALKANAGKTFLSKSHKLVKDRDFLLLMGKEETSANRYYIEAGCRSIAQPLKLDFEEIKKTPDFQFSSSSKIADFDLEKLTFPLILKKWGQGEYFQPLGMEGFKKISDFFIDEKVSLPEKEATWILYSANKVVWIIGKRIDNRFKITPDTKQVLRIKQI